MKDRKDAYIAIVLAALIIAFQPGESRTLSVNGNGEAAAAPDTASLTFYVSSLEPTAAAKSDVTSRFIGRLTPQRAR